MIKNFISRLQPVNQIEEHEWCEVTKEFDNEFSEKNPNLFWYLSSGFDTKALVHFNEKDTSDVYHSPTVDIFIYSDYSELFTLNKYYDELDNGSICLHKDRGKLNSSDSLERMLIFNRMLGENVKPYNKHDFRTYVSLDQIIPLRFFSLEECQIINQKYQNTVHRGMPINGEGIFYYCLINIWSKYFGDEYFPILFIPMDNWVLMEEIWKPYAITFDYICGVCDGCRKGGAYKCVNEFYSDFLTVMKKNCYWISDHLYSKPKSFHQIALLKGWGSYHEKNRSFLYRINR